MDGKADKEMLEIRKYQRIRCPKCLDFRWEKTDSKKGTLCPDCKNNTRT